MNDNNISDQLKLTRIIYFALIIGMIFLFAIALFIVENKKIEPIQSIDVILRLLIPLAGAAVMFFVQSVYKKNISSIDFNQEISSKNTKYRTFKIIQWASLEIVGFFSIVGFVITSNYLYVIVFLFLLGFFALIKPSKEQFFNDFKISSDQKKYF